MLGIFMDYQVFQGAGTLGVGVGARYGWVDGKALTLDGGTSSDEVGMNLVPLTLSLTYRFDLAQNELGLPLVPYVKGGLTYALWWFTDGKNDISVSDADGTSGAGGTFGWHGGGGLQLLLDFFAPSMAQDFEQDVGVNNSYLFVEVMVNQINDFGSATSINLGDTTLSFGLMLEI